MYSAVCVIKMNEMSCTAELNLEKSLQDVPSLQTVEVKPVMLNAVISWDDCSNGMFDY